MKVYEDEEETYGVRIKDNNNRLWNMQIDKVKYPELYNGDIIRIRSARGFTKDKHNILESRLHTNILKFVKDSKIVKNLQKCIQDTDLDIVICDKEEPSKPIYVTQEIKRTYARPPIKTSLIDLFFTKDSESGIQQDSSEDYKIEIDS